jgi:hypothetical protein
MVGTPDRFPHWKVLTLSLLLAAMLSLAACGGGGSGGGGGGGGSGGGDTSPSPSTTCGSASTCGNIYSVLLGGAGDAITAAASDTSADVCISIPSHSVTDVGVLFTMTFSNCVIANGADSLTVNGSITVSTTASDETISSSQLTIRGSVGGVAINIACAVSVTDTFSPTPSMSGSICGTSFGPPTGAPIITVNDNIPAACSVHLAWEPAEGATYYMIYFSPETPVPVHSGATVTFAPDQSALEWDWYIGAGMSSNAVVMPLNAFGEGPQSEEVVVNAPATCP